MRANRCDCIGVLLCALIIQQLGRGADCLGNHRNGARRHGGTLAQRQCDAISWRPVAAHGTLARYRAGSPPKYATVADHTKADKRARAGIVELLSQSYHAIRRAVTSRVQKLVENRRKALASTHPLRHQTWRITIQRRSGLLGLKRHTEQLIIDFMEDGSLTTSKGHKGKWWSEFGDVVWKIYFDPRVDVATYFNAQFCWNNFGEAAFMRRGVVYQDRPPGGWLPQYLFRPVLGKFTAEGVP